MENQKILDMLHYIEFNIGNAINTRCQDCLDDKLHIEDYTENKNLFFTDNWLPKELTDIPGKYVWIGFYHGRGKTLKKFLPEMRIVANKIANNGIVYDFTNETDMLFVFIPED